MSSSTKIPVTALSPLSCGALVWRIGGVTRLTLVAKATYAIAPGAVAETAPPLPLIERDQDRGAGRALDEASDMAPHLPSAGVLLRGTAHARGAPQPSVIVSLGVFRYQWLVRKRLVVRGDPGGPAGFSPFSSMPLVYERALGGPSVSANPAGNARSPNIVDPENVHRPAGFGPVSPRWSPRCELAPRSGAADPSALDLPVDVDFRYFHAAPPDQQFPYLEGDEWIALEGVHPSLELIRTRIPSAQAAGRVWLPTPGGLPASELAVRMVADTLSIDADRMVVSVVWRGHCELPRGEVPRGISAAVGLSLPNQPVVFPAPPRRGRHVLDGTAAVDEAEIARARERVGAPFQVANPGQGQRAATGVVHATPFIVKEVHLRDAPAGASRAASGDILGAAREAEKPLKSGRSSIFDRTLEQKERPVAGPVAPFPIASPGGAPSPGGSIPGAPFQRSGAPDARLEREPPPVDPAVPAAAAPPEPPEPSLPARPPEPPPAQAAPAPAEQGLRAIVIERARRSASMGDLDLAGADLRGLDLAGALLERQNLRGALLAGCKLGGAHLASADLTGADLTEADLRDADLSGADLTRATLTQTKLHRARMIGVTLVSARGSGAKFAGALLDRADLRSVRFTDCSFDGARLRGATAPRADFSGCRFVRAELAEVMFRGARMARVVLAFASLTEADLRDVNLEGANLHGIERQTAKLTGANLRGVSEDAPPSLSDDDA